MKKVYVLVLNDVFGQNLKPWSSLNALKMKNKFIERGFRADVIEYNDCLKLNDIKGSYFLTSSAQNKGQKKYIEDVCYELVQRGALLVPTFQLLKAHENKGYQALMSTRLDLKKPQEQYCISSAAIKDRFDNKEYVIKTVDGAGSHGVSLVKSQSDLKSFIFKNILKFSGAFEVARWFKYYIKSRGGRVKEYESICDYYRPEIGLCSQEFLENLKFDYKVIIMGKKLFSLKRKIKKGDFRASGSNLFEFEEGLNIELFNFAFEQFEKVGAPYLSLDIAYAEGSYYLIEFQCPHFGPYTVLEADHFFTKENGSWFRSTNSNVCLESMYVDAISTFIDEEAE